MDTTNITLADFWRHTKHFISGRHYHFRYKNIYVIGSIDGIEQPKDIPAGPVSNLVVLTVIPVSHVDDIGAGPGRKIFLPFLKSDKAWDINSPCYCGSGKLYKNCCIV